jgi:hypothetical protein
VLAIGLTSLNTEALAQPQQGDYYCSSLAQGIAEGKDPNLAVIYQQVCKNHRPAAPPLYNKMPNCGTREAQEAMKQAHRNWVARTYTSPQYAGAEVSYINILAIDVSQVDVQAQRIHCTANMASTLTKNGREIANAMLIKRFFGLWYDANGVIVAEQCGSLRNAAAVAAGPCE